MLNLRQKSKGLCFRCEAKYSPGHRWKDKQLQVLLVHEDFHEQEVPSPLSFSDLQEGDVKEVAELSLNSVVGISSLRTMKVKGKITQHEVITLIDCGATHNFIFSKVVQNLGFPVEATSGYGVLLGKGQTIKGEGICKGVVLTIQNIEIVEDFLPIEIVA